MKRIIQVFLFSFFVLMSTRMLRDHDHWQKYLLGWNLWGIIAIAAFFAVGMYYLKRVSK